MSEFRILGLKFENITVIFEISVLELVCNNKNPLGPTMPYLSPFGLEFENDIVIFEISTLEFV